MASIVTIPFNFQPVSTVVTSSLTLSAGTYAYAQPLSPACTLGGSEVFALATITFSAVPPAGGLIAPANFTGRIRSGATSTTKALAYGTATTLISASGTTRVDAYFKDGSIVSVVAGTVNTAPAAGDSSLGIHFSSGTPMSIDVTPATLAPVWLKAGDVLAGGPWLVTTYNSLT